MIMVYIALRPPMMTSAPANTSVNRTASFPSTQGRMESNNRPISRTSAVPPIRTIGSAGFTA